MASGSLSMKHIFLSKNGADRATAYIMSNKLILLPGGYFFTCLTDSVRINGQLVNPVTGQIP